MSLKNPSFLHPELKFQMSRSSGAGGQNVNKVNTRVELRFNIMESEFLTEAEKEILLEKLSNRINQANELIIASEKTRSQFRNKLDSISRFDELIMTALQPEKPRISTKPTRQSKIKRLESKKSLALRKQNRKKPDI
jgi:ribosome-associated protein